METETVNSGNVETVTVSPTITIYDYMTMNDTHINEEKLIKAFDIQLAKIEAQGTLGEYEKSLKETKKAKQLKINAYKMIALGFGVTKEKWDEDIKPYLLRTNFSFTDSDVLEYPDYVRDSKNPNQLKEITKVKLTNNLTDQLDKKLPFTTIEHILENYELDGKTQNSFVECIESLKDKTSEEILNTHVVKANSDMFTTATNAIKNRYEEAKLNLDNHQKTLEMSVSFITWKLKRIAIRKNLKKQNALDTDFLKMEEKVSIRLKSDKKFNSLNNIAKKWSL